MTRCEECEYYKKSNCSKVMPSGSSACVGFTRRKTQTNGDKLRSMTDKELSRWIASMERRALFTNSMTRPEGWQKWLESEANQNDNDDNG